MANVVLSLDDNQMASVDMQPNSSGDKGDGSRVDIDILTYESSGPEARKKVRFK